MKNFSKCTKFSFSEIFSFVHLTLELLKALTPNNSIDVSTELFADLKSKNDWEKLRTTTAFFRCLRNFLAQTTGTYDENFFDNLKFPILHLIWKSNQATRYQMYNDNSQCLSIFRPTDQNVLFFCL